MYLNSAEDDHKKIENFIDKISDHLHTKRTTEINCDEIEDDLQEIVRISKVIFKKEWDKSKKLFKI